MEAEAASTGSRSTTARRLQLLRRLRPVQRRLHPEAVLERIHEVRRRHSLARRRTAPPSSRRGRLRKIGGLTTAAKKSAKSDPLAPFQRAGAALVRGLLRGADAGPGGGLGGDLRRRQRADLRPDRLRQDARQLPLGDRQARPRPGARAPGCKLVYVSPLKALSYDIERNLRAPLRGIGAEISVGLRTGDTSQTERRQMAKNPPDILITTPESLYLMLSSQVRETLTGVEAVIVDEIHAVAQTKRGAHLALTLERLEDHVRQHREEAAEGRRSAREAPTSPTAAIQRIGLVGHPAAAGADRAVPRRAEARMRDRRCGAAQGARPGDRGPGRGHVGPRGARLSVRGRAAADRSRARAPTSARSGRRSTRSCSSWSRNTPRRSSSSTTAAAAERLAKRLNELANGEGEEELPATEHAGHGGGTGRVLRRATARRLVGGPSRARPLRGDCSGAPWVAVSRGADAGRGAAEDRASCRASSRPPRWSWGSTWGRSTS